MAGLDEAIAQRRAERLDSPMLLLDPILDQLKAVVEYDDVMVVKVAGEYTVTVGYRGDTPLADALRSSFRADLPEDTIDWLRHRVPMLVSDVLDEMPESQEFRLRIRRRFGEFNKRIRSFLCVPLAVEDRWIGLLAIFHNERSRYTAREMDLVQSFVKQRATEIKHAILYADAARLADEAQAVLTVQQTIVSRLDPDAILQKTAEEVQRLTASRRALVFRRRGDCFRLASAAGEPARWLPLGWQTPIAGSLLGKVLETGKPIFFDSLEGQTHAGAAGLLSLASKSLLIFPIRSDDQSLGVIVAADKQMGMFGPNDERVVAMLASTAVIGLENARVHLQAQRLARMEERQRIAQSLHDTVAQMLFSIVLAIKRALKEPLESESARQNLEIARRLSARGSEELRSAIFALSKPELRGGHSLIDLLREQVKEFQSESGVSARFVAPVVVDELPHPVGEAIYRIVRESLTNVQKHAQATHVEVRLRSTEDSIEVVIQDDGNGLDKTKSNRAMGQNLQFGVDTMRQLAAQVKGEFTIANNEEGGVTVEARLPINGGRER
ncbi:MAG: GAF domain-containing sensor histidine kinase [Anaerolineales bacterium]|nr:GAF domain-containing sensor histidine kinase [Anaerolineales bacterium]